MEFNFQISPQLCSSLATFYYINDLAVFGVLVFQVKVVNSSRNLAVKNLAENVSFHYWQTQWRQSVASTVATGSRS